MQRLYPYLFSHWQKQFICAMLSYAKRLRAFVEKGWRKSTRWSERKEKTFFKITHMKKYDTDRKRLYLLNQIFSHLAFIWIFLWCRCSVLSLHWWSTLKNESGSKKTFIHPHLREEFSFLQNIIILVSLLLKIKPNQE
jgi:hypothetical protein